MRPSPRGLRASVAGSLVVSAALLVCPAAPGSAAAESSPPGAAGTPLKTPLQSGYGGAVATVDAEASKVALQVLKRGGNAADAAVAAAAALGVTEPYSAGIGGGGYFVHYDAKTGHVRTIDGRETAPSAMPRDAFIDPATGEPYPFTPERVTSGVGVGVPGTLATWERALKKFGTWSLKKSLRPAQKLAAKGFEVDDTFRQQTLDNEERFAAFPASKRLFLPKGDAPKVGSTFRNRDLAATYRMIRRGGTKRFYRGKLARLMASVVRKPRTSKRTDLPVPRGYLRVRDLTRYKVRNQHATHVAYRGYDVYGMAPSSSGGTTVGEALNIMERYDLSTMTPAAALHHYLEASALAFADRGAYLGDRKFVVVPVDRLLDDTFAAERACAISETTASTKPVAAGDTSSYDGVCGTSRGAAARSEDTENVSTTNLVVADKDGNVVAYTLTIEQTGGSGQVVPGHGFLLNNELTDFSTVYDRTDPNRIRPNKRPRSSMSPTIVLKGDKPFLALGSPGGSTIITTVLQTLMNRIDLDMSIGEAIAAPRASQRNTADVTAEPSFIDAYGPALTTYGHSLQPSGDAFTSSAEIGAATAIELGPGRRMTAAAEPTRRGGGTARVVRAR